MLQVGDIMDIEKVKGDIKKTSGGKYYIYILHADRVKLSSVFGTTNLTYYSEKQLPFFKYASLVCDDVPDFYTLDELERWLNTLKSIIETKRYIKFLK